MPPRSKIDTQLPPDVKAWLQEVLLDRRHPGYIALSEMLKEKGYDISHAAVHRFDQRVQRAMSTIRASTEAAKLITSISPDQADEHSAAIIRLVQSELFESLLRVREAGEETDPAAQVKLLARAAQAIAQSVKASITQKHWQDEVSAKLNEIEKKATQSGRTLDAATLAIIRESLYGG